MTALIACRSPSLNDNNSQVHRKQFGCKANHQKSEEPHCSASQIENLPATEWLASFVSEPPPLHVLSRHESQLPCKQTLSDCQSYIGSKSHVENQDIYRNDLIKLNKT